MNNFSKDNYYECNNMLSHIENSLDRRIDVVDKINTKHREILRYLIHCKKEKENELIQIENEKIQKEEYNNNNNNNNNNKVIDESRDNTNTNRLDDDINISTLSLDSILDKAREIRELSKPKQLIKISSKNNNNSNSNNNNTNDKNVSSSSTTTSISSSSSSSSSLKSSLKRNPSISMTSKSNKSMLNEVNNTNYINESKQMSISNNISCAINYDDLHKQLDLLIKEPLKPIITSLDIDKELYNSQYLLLSSIADRPSFPKSNLYSLISQSIDIPCPFSSEQINNNNNEQIIILTLMIKRLREDFNKKLKSKLCRLPLNSPSLRKDDKMEIMESWYRIQRCIHMYEILREKKNYNSFKTNDIIDKSNEMWTLINDIIDSTPICTPIQSNSTYTSISSKEWINHNIEKIENFHKSFDSRILFGVESVIGKYHLKYTIQKLKNCCEREMFVKSLENENNEYNNNNNKNNDYLLEKDWILSLKSYKSLYSCLLNEGSDRLSCVFLEKNSNF